MVWFCKTVLERLHESILKRGWLMTARMEMDYNMDFWKSDMLSVFQSFKFAPKSLNLCKNVVSVWNFFKKLLFIIYLELIKLIFHTFRDHFVHFYNSSDQMLGDTLKCPFNVVVVVIVVVVIVVVVSSPRDSSHVLTWTELVMTLVPVSGRFD